MAAVLFAGCAKEIDAPQAGDFKTITIQAEIPQTKVGIDNNGKSSWQTGDKIGIHTQNGAIAEFTYQENNTFKGQIAADDELSEEYILPKAFDERIGKTVAKAVGDAAIKTNVARII